MIWFEASVAWCLKALSCLSV